MKVLQVSMGLEFGGIENLEMNILKYGHTHFTCDFLTPNNDTFKDKKNEINKLGGTIYHLNTNRKNIFSKIIYFFRLKEFLKNNHYDIIHINSGVFLFSLQVAYLSKKYNYKVINHIHSIPKVSKLKRLIINLLMPMYFKKVDISIACSNKAKEKYFSNKYLDKVLVIEDGIDINKYKYNEKVRNKLRTKYNLDKYTVYGHIGRFVKEKNHEYLIDLFYEIEKKDKNAYLVLIGDGVLKETIKSKINSLGLSKKVLIIDNIIDTSDIINIIDICIFPSISEGFGISLLETQTNGIITYASTNIPEEVNITKCFKYFDLNDKSIVDKIITSKNRVNRKDFYKNIPDKYNIINYYKQIERLYLGDNYEN